MIAYRGRCIEQNGQKILFYVANFCGVLLQTVHDKLNVLVKVRKSRKALIFRGFGTILI